MEASRRRVVEVHRLKSLAAAAQGCFKDFSSGFRSVTEEGVSSDISGFMCFLIFTFSFLSKKLKVSLTLLKVNSEEKIRNFIYAM